MFTLPTSMTFLSTLLLPLRRALLERRERTLSLRYRSSLEEAAYLENLHAQSGWWMPTTYRSEIQDNLINKRAQEEALEAELVEVRVALAMLSPNGGSSAATDR